MRSGETPVPIPNTTVKTRAAESTILATVWEDRWLPDMKKIVLCNMARKCWFEAFTPQALVCQTCGLTSRSFAAYV